MNVKPDWRDMSPAAKIALVQSVYEPGMSAGEIAIKVGGGISRSAILGLYTRCRDLAVLCPIGGGNAVRAAAKKYAPVRSPQPSTPTIRTDAPEPRHLTLIDLTDRTCKWPHGDQDFTFCGAEKDFGGSYCRYHERLAYTPARA